MKKVILILLFTLFFASGVNANENTNGQKHDFFYSDCLAYKNFTPIDLTTDYVYLSGDFVQVNYDTKKEILADGSIDEFLIDAEYRKTAVTLTYIDPIDNTFYSTAHAINGLNKSPISNDMLRHLKFAIPRGFTAKTNEELGIMYGTIFPSVTSVGVGMQNYKYGVSGIVNCKAEFGFSYDEFTNTYALSQKESSKDIEDRNVEEKNIELINDSLLLINPSDYQNTSLMNSSGLPNMKKYGLLTPIKVSYTFVKGKAYIYTTLPNEGKRYIEIEILSTKENEWGWIDFIIKDKDFVKKYGGNILRGMSGSPIIQNGKLIGALSAGYPDSSTKGCFSTMKRIQPDFFEKREKIKKYIDLPLDEFLKNIK